MTNTENSEKLNMIKVDLAFDFRRHLSLEAAVAKGRQAENNELKRIEGRAVVGYQFDGAQLMLSFDNGAFFVVSIGADALHWCVSNEEVQLGEQPPTNEVFELPSGNKFEWGWKSVLDTFVGHRVLIRPSDQLLFLHVPGGKEFLISAYVDRMEHSRLYLDISET